MKDKFNFNFDENDVPVGVGDRYYAQDMVRDNRYLQSLALRATASICQRESGILKGLKISQSSPTIIGLTGGSGFCHFSVKVPDDSAEWAVPAHTKNEDILALVDVEAQAIQLTEEMLDGNLRYIKIRYREENINSRVRQNLGGSYTYVVTDSYQLVVDENPATKYDILLGTFSGDGETLSVTPIKTELERIIDEAIDFAIDDEIESTLKTWSSDKINNLFKNNIPCGTLQQGLFKIAPDGWLLCDGQTEYSRTDPKYIDIWNLLKDIPECQGDGSTTFTTPDLRELVLVGAGTNNKFSIASHDVYQLGEFKDDQMQGHWHSEKHQIAQRMGQDGSIDFRSVSSSPNDAEYRPGDTVIGAPTTDGVNGEPRTGSTTHGKQVGVNYIIKY